MSSVKKLAGQTLWYGVPTMASRFLGYILSIFLFRWYGPSVTADITQVYALIPFLNILFTYGLETAYFRYASRADEKQLFNTLSISLLVSSLLFSAALLLFTEPLARFTSLQDKPEYFRWMVYILFFDTLSVIPFARLRQQERPRKYAFVKVANMVLTVLFSIYFLRICPLRYAEDPQDPFLVFYNPGIGIGYYIIANAVASAVSLLLLWDEWKGFRLQFNSRLWKEVMIYAYPLIIVGFGGMINEMLSRLVYSYVL
ncbi:MAG: oligosaccharide flippase family protein, partial [Chitinophagaceae bacterium]|nr:oligosaccharide flippase family protein [Chitinophagaceae bacterium]